MRSKYKPMKPTKTLVDQLALLFDRAPNITLDSRLMPLLVTSSQVVSAHLVGETVTFAAIRRTRSITDQIVDDIGVLEGSLDWLPRSRRGSALRVQPELRRALATRALNAAGVHLASHYVHTCLTDLYDDLAFPDFELVTSKRARAAIRPLVLDPIIGVLVCELVSLVDGCEQNPERWQAVLAVARHLLERHCYSHDVGAVAKAWLPMAPTRPLAQLRHRELQPVLESLALDGSDLDRAVEFIDLAEPTGIGAFAHG